MKLVETFTIFTFHLSSCSHYLLFLCTYDCQMHMGDVQVPTPPSPMLCEDSKPPWWLGLKLLEELSTQKRTKQKKKKGAADSASL